MLDTAGEKMKDILEAEIRVLDIELSELAEPMNAVLLMHTLDEMIKRHIRFQRDELEDGPLTDSKEYKYDNLDEQYSYIRSCLHDITDSLVHYDIRRIVPGQDIYTDSWPATDLKVAMLDYFEVDIEKLKEYDSSNFGIPGDHAIEAAAVDANEAHIEFEGGAEIHVEISEDQHPVLY